jgi:hydrogenase maturation protein HypF
LNHAQRWDIGGCVQGVGYRPYVYRLALSFKLTGWVRNNAGAVEIHAEGEAEMSGGLRGSLVFEAAADRQGAPAGALCCAA